MADREQRLTTLQADYKLLQDSYEQLDASKAGMKRNHELAAEELRSRNAQMEEKLTRMKDVSREFESLKCGLSNKLDTLQSALDQSEVELVKCEDKLKVH